MQADKDHGHESLAFCHFAQSLHELAYDKVDDTVELQATVRKVGMGTALVIFVTMFMLTDVGVRVLRRLLRNTIL